MAFNILVEVACNSGKIVNAEAYGDYDLAGYIEQRGFTAKVEGVVHPTYRHRNGLTALAVVSRCAKFDAAQELTALIRRIGVVGTEVKARKRRAARTPAPAVKAATTAMDAYLEGILAK